MHPAEGGLVLLFEVGLALARGGCVCVWKEGIGNPLSNGTLYVDRNSSRHLSSNTFDTTAGPLSQPSSTALRRCPTVLWHREAPAVAVNDVSVCVVGECEFVAWFCKPCACACCEHVDLECATGRALQPPAAGAEHMYRLQRHGLTPARHLRQHPSPQPPLQLTWKTS